MSSRNSKETLATVSSCSPFVRLGIHYLRSVGSGFCEGAVGGAAETGLRRGGCIQLEKSYT